MSQGSSVHLTAVVDDAAVLGEGTKVWAFCVLQRGVTLGERCVVGTHTFIGMDAELGDDVRIMGQCYIPTQIQIGNRVFIGPGVIFTGDRHPRVNSGHVEEPVVIEDDVSVGAHAVVLAGVRLGKGCMIGAGAVVTKDVPAGETWLGNPARKMREPNSIFPNELAEHKCIAPYWCAHVSHHRPRETDDNVGCLQGL